MALIVVTAATPWYPAEIFRVPGGAITIARDVMFCLGGIEAIGRFPCTPESPNPELAEKMNAMGDLVRSGLMANIDRHEYGEAISFGPFTLFPEERRLERSGSFVQLGSRAMDILIVLIQHAGQVVDRRMLMSCAWRNIVVDESNLRVNIAGLRKALGDGDDGARYVKNVPGIGYCFVGRLTRDRVVVNRKFHVAGSPALMHAEGFATDAACPQGRDEVLLALASNLTVHRLVSIVGPGGIGKTTVAVALAKRLSGVFSSETHFADFSEVAPGDTVALTLACLLGLSDLHDKPVACISNYLSTRRALIILDNCEHIINDVTSLTAQILAVSPTTHFVLTSREALRVRYEYVYRLPALEVPPPFDAMSIEDAHTYPAVQVFLQRAMAVGARFPQTNKNYAAISEICRELEGVALAIEFAAARVATFGLAGTIALLGTRSRLQWQGCRNAPARHRNLEASIEWSYALLSERERSAFHLLSSFEQPATLDAVVAAVANGTDDLSNAIDAIEGLVAKHILQVLTGQDDLPRYRLPASERIYAREQLRRAAADDRSAIDMYGLRSIRP
ncbi:winged helix-turn-helix domain-containing protein [Paraburkholderia sediminicola]|uniref:ATP-binding protein n=1 Tax=Paraburkholderia sediminicola TaxID=458836 RepID=UPI0038B6D310